VLSWGDTSILADITGFEMVQDTRAWVACDSGRLTAACTMDLRIRRDDADADPANELQQISKEGSTVTLSQGGGSFTDAVNDADANPLNEMQQLSRNGNQICISGQNCVEDKVGTPAQFQTTARGAPASCAGPSQSATVGCTGMCSCMASGPPGQPASCSCKACCTTSTQTLTSSCTASGGTASCTPTGEQLTGCLSGTFDGTNGCVSTGSCTASGTCEAGGSQQCKLVSCTCLAGSDGHCTCSVSASIQVSASCSPGTLTCYIPHVAMCGKNI
jgi:hypothetical protein